MKMKAFILITGLLSLPSSLTGKFHFLCFIFDLMPSALYLFVFQMIKSADTVYNVSSKTLISLFLLEKESKITVLHISQQNQREVRKGREQLYFCLLTLPSPAQPNISNTTTTCRCSSDFAGIYPLCREYQTQNYYLRRGTPVVEKSWLSENAGITRQMLGGMWLFTKTGPNKILILTEGGGKELNFRERKIGHFI